MLLSPVHKNELETLYVHEPLVQRVFGIQPRKGAGRCLLTQVAYSINAVCPKARVSRIVTHVDKHVSRKIGEDGHTINEILEALKRPMKVDDGYLKLELELEPVLQYDSLIHKMITGQPVMIMFDRDVCAVLLNEAISYQDGEIRATVIRHGQTGMYHSLLAMGLDLNGYVILRDSRSKYAYKGYAKISTSLLQDGWKFLNAMAIRVHDYERVTAVTD